MGIHFYTVRDMNCSKGNLTWAGKFLVILFSFLFFSFSGFSQTASFSFSQIPFSNPDIVAPDRGAEQWNGAPWDNNWDPYIPAGNATPPNFYYRFNWTDIESSTTQGSYNWSIFDNYIHQAMDKGAMFSFGVMPMCTACGLSGYG